MNVITDTHSVTGVFTSSQEHVASADSDNIAFEPAVMSSRQGRSEWSHNAIHAVQGLTLASDWDSYGGLTVDPRSIANAAQVIDVLARVIGLEKRPPTIGATPSGHVAMSWDLDQWSLDLIVEPNGTLSFVYLEEWEGGSEIESQTRDLSLIAALLSQWTKRSCD